MSETTTIDKAGRLVVPKAMREKLGLRAGSKVRLEVIGDRLELMAELEDFQIAYRPDGRPVIVGGDGFDAAEAVREAREERTERLLRPFLKSDD